MKLPYFKLKEAFNEAKDSFSYGSGSDKLSSTAKLLGKFVANTGMLAVEIGAEAIKKAPEHIGKTAQNQLNKNSDSMSEEQIARLKKIAEKGNEAREIREQKEREESKKEHKEP